MRRLNPRVLAIALLLLLAAPAPSLRADARPPELPAAGELEIALRKLRVVGAALYVAAHPDDENTALLAYLARGRMVRAGYLSVTRGDGGQNLIGPETGSALGVIRTQELLEARRIDHAEQFFTRAVDFGYSKSADETLEIWDREAVLGDVVRVIRTFRPDVIITRFPRDGAGGHGHHTASAMLAQEAFEAAADPKRFPEQLGNLQPWRAKRVVWNSFRPDTGKRDPQLPPLVRADVGEYAPLLGEAWSEIAGRSRSMHKSQGFGAPERRGSIPSLFEHSAGEAATKDLFDGIDLTWKRVRGGEAVDAILAEAERAFDPDAPARSVPALLRVLDAMKTLPPDPFVIAKREELLEVIRGCLGLWLEAVAEAPTGSPGDTVRVTALALQRSPAAVTLEALEMPFRAPATTGTGSAAKPFEGAPLADNRPASASARVRLPENAVPTQPFWLEETPTKGAFAMPATAFPGAPWNEPPLHVRFRLRIDTHDLVYDVPVVYRWTDRVVGERYRPFQIVPPVTLRFGEEAYLFADKTPRELQVTVEAARAASGAVRLELPKGWTSEPAERPVSLTASGETTVRFQVRPGAATAAEAVRATFVAGERRHDRRRVTIDYEHVPVTLLFPPAEARLVRADVAHRGRAVGYVEGSGDATDDALRQLGYTVTPLSDADVETADLARYDAIVLGVRAFNTRPRLRALAPRLHGYVRAGGTLVVQYNTSEDALKDRIGPFPFTISRDRVTVEEAPIELREPASPVLTTPNKITAADFEGWVQERGLYYANPWDPRYAAPLAANDPGEKPLAGGLLVARDGQGTFVYTGLAFFRQLPAGVPGAWRLFANLVSGGK